MTKEPDIYSPEEAGICLNCTAEQCPGECERLKEEKRHLKEEKRRLLLEHIYETEEFIFPEEPPWPKENPYIKTTKEGETDAT